MATAALIPAPGRETVTVVPQVGAEPVLPRRATNHETNLEPFEEGTRNWHHTLIAERRSLWAYISQNCEMLLCLTEIGR